MAPRTPPEGYSTVTPNIIVEGAGRCIEFVAAAFGGQERMRVPMPDGRIAHAEVQIGDSVIMLSDPQPGFPATPAVLLLYLPDVDNVYQRALSAGATSQMEPADQFYGDRSATVQDPFGNRWSIATHIEDVSDEEMMKRMAAMA